MGPSRRGGSDFHLSYFHSLCRLPLTLHNVISTFGVHYANGSIVPPTGFDVNPFSGDTAI